MISKYNLSIKKAINSHFKITNRSLKHGFTFVSLISPHAANNVRLLAPSPSFGKKLLMKQSYILLTWFYYISTADVRRGSRNSGNTVELFAAPVKKRIFTLTKAPMAHKNWSKEQYKFYYRTFRISFCSTLHEENILDSLNSGLFFMLIGKSSLPQFETNLLFLKTCSVRATICDKNYFSFYKFLASQR